MSGENINTEQSVGTDIDLAAVITDKHLEWSMLKEEAMEKWRENEAYKYATDTTSLPNFSSPFEHTTHIPVVDPIAQDLEAIINQVVIPHEDWFDFAPLDRSAAKLEARFKVKTYLKNRHRLGGFVKAVRSLISDVVTYGNAFVLVAYVDESKANKKGYIGSKLVRISPYDITFDPTCAEFKSTPKIIKELVSLGELKKRASKGLLDENVVNEILRDRRSFGTRSITLTNKKSEQYTPAGFGTYEQYVGSGNIELLWFYGDLFDSDSGELLEARKIVVADGKYVLLNEEIKTIDGLPHIYKAGWEDRPDNLWSAGPIDNIVGLNYQINHRENAKSDALDKLICPDKVFIGDVEVIYDDETGTREYLAPEGGGVQELGVNTQFFSFDLHIDRLDHFARKSARLPTDLTGFRSAGEKTLGEVTALTEGGMRGFVHKAQDFEMFLEQIITAELELARENLTSVIQVAGQVNNGVIPFLEISSEDLKINGELVAQGARRFARKQQILGTLTQLSATPIYQQAATHMSGKKLAKLLADLTETTEEGIFEEFAAVLEQAEAQKVQSSIQQHVAADMSQEGLQDSLLDLEQVELEEEAMNGEV